ncbi:MAG: hypothetical protein HAW59_04135 [Betaproteobacteria bacterium]|nr:hypothetical protein [Betaproteobacteria bacterium]
MNAYFAMFCTLIVAAYAVAVWFTVRRHQKHDRVLFSFSRLQSAVMKEILARHDAETLTRKQYEAAKFLMDMLDVIALHYDRHKTTMFNLRKMRRFVAEDLACYEETEEKVRAHFAEISADEKIAALYGEFSRAAARAFLAYTPFIRTEIILRLLLGDAAKQIAQIRREQEVSGEKFA